MKHVLHRLRSAASLSLLAFALPAAAHHSTSEYDRDTVIELAGEVVDVVWSNPHVGLTIEVTQGDGTEQRWRMEAADLTGTTRRGVPAGIIQVGQQVKVAGFASTRRDGRGGATVLLRTLT